MSLDISGAIERLEALEDRAGVRLENMSAFIRSGDPAFVSVTGEIHSTDGAHLEYDVEVVCAAYDTSGRVVQTASAYYGADNFYGLEIFDFTMSLPVDDVARVRIFPKRR